MSREDIYKEVQAEQERQLLLHGDQTHLPPVTWMTILMEEVGEASKELCDNIFKGKDLYNFRTEMIQVAAVAMSIIEAYDKDFLPQEGDIE